MLQKISKIKENNKQKNNRAFASIIIVFHLRGTTHFHET